MTLMRIMTTMLLLMRDDDGDEDDDRVLASLGATLLPWLRGRLGRTQPDFDTAKACSRQSNMLGARFAIRRPQRVQTCATWVPRYAAPNAPDLGTSGGHGITEYRHLQGHIHISAASLRWTGAVASSYGDARALGKL